MQATEFEYKGAPTLVMPSQGRLVDGAEYKPAAATNVQDTWRKFGWKPMTDEERAERLARSRK